MYFYKNYASYFILILIVLFNSCNTDENVPLATGESFYPLEVGIVREYLVNEIEYLNDDIVSDTTYYLKEEIVESFINAQDSVYIIYQYTRPSDVADWEFLDTWSAQVNSQQLIIKEGNTPFVKLTFPIYAGKTWNGNSQNQFDEDLYLMDSLYFNYVVNDQQFENTLTVIQNDNQDLIVEQDRRFEIYGLNIGLIRSEELLYKYCTDDNCLGQQQIQSGFLRSQQLIEYGKN